MFIPKVFKYQLYLFQLENYEFKRFWKLLQVKGFLPGTASFRKKLVWTAKARLLALVAACAQLLAASIIALIAQKLFGLEFIVLALAFLILLYGFITWSFLFFGLSAVILYPVDALWKKYLASRARHRIQTLPHIHTIAVAGSYGKTTMKHIVAGILSGRKHVQATPESFNTPVGVSRFVLQNVGPETEIVVVEMGEHYKGDIEYLCKITPPDTVIITGINESHLERFGNMETTIGTIFEAVVNAKPNACIFLNGDDERVVEHYEKYIGNRKVFFYSEHPENALCDIRASDVAFSQDGHGFSFALQDGTKSLGEFKTKLLGSYVIGNVIAAVQIAHRLGISFADMQHSLADIAPVPHRLEPLFGQQDVLVIDDSYNGNPDGVREAIEVLSQFASRRKIYITPGLVETGKKAEEIHRKIGEQLTAVADVVILVKNSVTPFIARGIKDYGLKIKDASPQVLWYTTAEEAHADLRNVLKPGDVILFQNDWGDQYV